MCQVGDCYNCYNTITVMMAVDVVKLSEVFMTVMRLLDSHTAT